VIDENFDGFNILLVTKQKETCPKFKVYDITFISIFSNKNKDLFFTAQNLYTKLFLYNSHKATK
jgi:hypothetical protein